MIAGTSPAWQDAVEVRRFAGGLVGGRRTSRVADIEIRGLEMPAGGRNDAK
jgi:hypothetical protein